MINIRPGENQCTRAPETLQNYLLSKNTFKEGLNSETKRENRAKQIAGGKRILPSCDTYK